VSQGVILRLLNKLGWPIFDSSRVSPEYTIARGRVDYALCHPPGKPIILIESKDVGSAYGAEKQLFEYAFHQGIPMAVLTDGQEWSFFSLGSKGLTMRDAFTSLTSLLEAQKNAAVFLIVT
jgi:predicted type IV restriction endonuclease